MSRACTWGGQVVISFVVVVVVVVVLFEFSINTRVFAKAAHDEHTPRLSKALTPFPCCHRASGLFSASYPSMITKLPSPANVDVTHTPGVVLPQITQSN